MVAVIIIAVVVMGVIIFLKLKKNSKKLKEYEQKLNLQSEEIVKFRNNLQINTWARSASDVIKDKINDNKYVKDTFHIHAYEDHFEIGKHLRSICDDYLSTKPGTGVESDKEIYSQYYFAEYNLPNLNGTSQSRFAFVVAELIKNNLEKDNIKVEIGVICADWHGRDNVIYQSMNERICDTNCLFEDAQIASGAVEQTEWRAAHNIAMCELHYIPPKASGNW